MVESDEIKHDTDILILFQRGRRISVVQGSHKWEAIYWGRDRNGEIVAEKNKGKWRLTYVDLHAMADRLLDGTMLTTQEIKEVEADLTEGMEVDE